MDELLKSIDVNDLFQNILGLGGVLLVGRIILGYQKKKSDKQDEDFDKLSKEVDEIRDGVYDLKTNHERRISITEIKIERLEEDFGKHQKAAASK